jgi:hypothetical protein
VQCSHSRHRAPWNRQEKEERWKVEADSEAAIERRGKTGKCRRRHVTDLEILERANSCLSTIWCKSQFTKHISSTVFSLLFFTCHSPQSFCTNSGWTLLVDATDCRFQDSPARPKLDLIRQPATKSSSRGSRYLCCATEDIGLTYRRLSHTTESAAYNRLRGTTNRTLFTGEDSSYAPGGCTFLSFSHCRCWRI